MSPEDLRRISEVRALVANGKAREQRKNRRLMLREIADAIGVTPLTVYRWEQGTAQPRGAHALRWADALGIEAKVS
ncbi:helix-turn-helix transcriptional regulator [Streptomyces sp. ActVer]|uniref:helix-turn-helix domain-containing protein n=1 Tax=Streptomyces sp. ActVer TaxID=3014558 RepID=UPI0022B50FC3|nr:helix-turn-helix transcriptional regulator [Streptomyces sp. ActVer]MCZ4508659.1 helix-turn-helix transcriptional regulator [Streptomyces sp. ActVer]